MTREEFLTYLESFKKKPGEFTREEIYSIGVAHKSLPVQDKSWSFVADAVGWLGTPGSLRSFINDKMRKEGKLTPKTELQSAETAAEEKLFADLYIEKTKIRDIYNAYRSTLRDEARIQVMMDELKEWISKIPSLPKVQYVYDSNRNSLSNEAILMLSDLHIGVNCDNFYNKYNYEIAQKRLSKLAQDTIYYCKLHNIKRLNVVNLGDAIHGKIHVNARIQAELDAAEQTIKAGEAIAVFLEKLQEAAPEVCYRSCSDNHARMEADKEQHIEEESFGKILDHILKLRLRDTDIKFCDDNIDYSLGKFNLMNGKVVMFAHGHLEGTSNKTFQSFIGAIRQFVDYGLLGHFHSARMKEFEGLNVFVNGSIVGTEQYALSKRLFSEPKQSLLLFDNRDNVVNVLINLNVQ